MQLAPTPKDVIHREGTARLYHFRGSAGAGGSSEVPAQRRLPVLLVPSLINRWYVLDLRRGASLVEALTAAGLDTYCLDWGVPEAEDRDLSWDDVLGRLRHAVRRVLRASGAPQVALLGYCMGGTLAGIHAALHPAEVGALINLAGPFDFSQAGMLGDMVNPKYFDAGAIAAAGNVGAEQMQAGFVALRPTATAAKLLGMLDRAHDPAAREGFEALETWAADNIPFPGAAYGTYIKDLYQDNLLVQGGHHVGGRRVDLTQIRCPVLSVAAERDAICPLPAARALCDHVGATDKEVFIVPGGHVGAVVGARAKTTLYPKLTTWLRRTACSSAN